MALGDLIGTQKITGQTGRVFTFVNVISEIWLEGTNTLHAYNEPAKVYKTLGTVYYSWYLYGKEIDEEEYQDWLADNNMDINNLTEEDKFLIGMKYDNG